MVLVDGKQLKCGAGGVSGVKIKIWQGVKYLKRGKVGIGKTIEMWWWCRENIEKIEGRGGGG